MEGTPFGRYRLIELLGRGGMGEVWRAFDAVTERVVALKVLPTQYADDSTFQQRFRREARSAAGLDDPHVVPIYDFGEIDGRLFVTMRLIQGRDLQSILADGPLEPTRAIFVMEQVAAALHAAHRVDLVHRDVKPSNVLVAEDDFTYLIDFGIARTTGETSLTNTGNVIGTWDYLAPERLTSDRTDHRVDIYSLTCLMHECLTGSKPFPGNSLEQQLGAHLTLPPPRPTDLRDDLPAGLDDVIATGMAKNPDDRFGTTKELAAAARAALATPRRAAQPRPTPPPPPQPTPPPQPLPGDSGGFARQAPNGPPNQPGWGPPPPQWAQAPTVAQPQNFSAPRPEAEPWWKRYAIALTAACAVVAMVIALPVIFEVTGSAQPSAQPALLSVAEINQVMGTKDLQVIDASRKLDDPYYPVTPPECAGIRGVNTKAAYAAAGVTEVDSQTLHARGKDVGSSVDQMIAKAPSADAASRFLQRRLEAWRACDGRENEAGGTKATAKIVVDGRARIAADFVYPAIPKFQCQLLYAVSGATIVQVFVCTDAGGAGTKADSIAAKILGAS